jgi:hypothetical protein
MLGWPKGEVMISELGREHLTGLGARFSGAHLLEQATYTLELAANDGKAIDRLLPNGYVAEVRRLVGSVLATLATPAIAAGEERELDEANSQPIREARKWRRKVARRASRARVIGRDVPDVLVRLNDVDCSAAVATQVSSMLAWLETEPDLLPGQDVAEIITSGKALAKQLARERVTEHAARLAGLPLGDQRFCEEKGELYVGLRVINDAGKELHAGNRTAASRYNLAVLSRRPVPARQ